MPLGGAWRDRSANANLEHDPKKAIGPRASEHNSISYGMNLTPSSMIMPSGLGVKPASFVGTPQIHYVVKKAPDRSGALFSQASFQ